MASRTSPEIFSQIADLNACYKGKRVRVTDNRGRCAVGTFVRAEQRRLMGRGMCTCILVDSETLHIHGKLAKAQRQSANPLTGIPLYGYTVFFLDLEDPQVEILTDEAVSTDG